jgi:hypothetical protein
MSATMVAADRVLILLYGEATWVSLDDLGVWAKYGPKSDLRKIARKLDARTVIEFDEESDRCLITPLGIT